MQLLRKHQKAGGAEFQEIFGKHHTDSVFNLHSGRADAFVMDAQVMGGNIATSRRPADFKIVGEVLGVEPIAIMVRKDSPSVEQSIDNTLRGPMKSGEIAQLYDKWLIKPIPPTNTDVNLPTSGETKAA